MSLQTGHQPWVGSPDALPLALFVLVTLCLILLTGKLAHSQPPCSCQINLGSEISSHQYPLVSRAMPLSAGMAQEWRVGQSAVQGGHKDSAHGTLASRPQVLPPLPSGRLTDPRASLFPLTLIPMAFRPEASRTSPVK